MKISLNWLKEYVDFDLSKIKIGELTHQLAVLGFEAESVEKISRTYDGIVIGKVLEKGQHPNADKLSICAKLDFFKGEVLAEKFKEELEAKF